MKIGFLRLFSVMLVLLLLVGCSQTPATPTQTAPTVPTQTVPPITQPTQPTEPEMDLEKVFQQMIYAVMNKNVYQYEQIVNTEYRTGAAGVYLRTTASETTKVTWSSDPFAINRETRYQCRMMDLEIDQRIISYYRREGQQLVIHRYAPELEVWEREEPDIAPSAILRQYRFGFWPSEIQEGMTLDAQTQQLGQREAYVLRYTQNALDYCGSTGDAAVDEQLSQIELPVTFYLDAQTFLPLQWEISLTDVVNLVSVTYIQDLLKAVGKELPDGQTIEFFSSELVFANPVYEPVEVPDMPEIDPAGNKQGNLV